LFHLTVVRWIDLGCPIDLDYDRRQPQRRGYGWMCDDNRPVVSVTYPQPGENRDLSRIVIGMHDYDSGLDSESLRVTADVPLDGAAPGTDLARRFELQSAGVWAWKLNQPVVSLARATLTIQVRDRQGNWQRAQRTFSVRATPRDKPVGVAIIDPWPR
jgi:hypothetical protein